MESEVQNRIREKDSDVAYEKSSRLSQQREAFHGAVSIQL